MEKLLTVSVAAYNGAATLQKALESCLVADESLQALLDVIIIDDGSTDSTPRWHRFLCRHTPAVSGW